MELTQEIVREFLDCFPEDGRLVWKHRDRKWFKNESSYKRWNARYAGKDAFTYDMNGYKQGAILYINYQAHRIIWLWVHGEWPNVIDHIDGNPSNNNIHNLRSVTQTENMRNQKLRNTNRSGHNGVSWSEERQRWIASHTINGKTRTIKRCKTKEEAIYLADLSRDKMNYHENHARTA